MSRRYVFTIVIFVLWILSFDITTGFFGGSLIAQISWIPISNILLCIGFYVLAVFTGILILYRSLRYSELKPPLKGLSKAWIFGSFLDNMTPTVTPVGEASMAYYLHRFYNMPYAKSLAGIALYVSSWGISVSFFSILAVILANHFVGLGPFLIPIVAIVAVFSLLTIGGLLLLTRRGFMKRAVCAIIRVYNKIYVRVKRRRVTFEECVFNLEFEKSYKSLEMVMKNRECIVVSVGLFMIPQLMHVLCLYTILIGLGADISFFHVLTIQIVASVAGLISFVPSGMGVYETVATGSLGGNIPLAMAGAAVFLYRIIFVWTTNIIGGLVGITSGIKDPGKIKAPD